jgi:shikimate kinase
MNLILIGYRGTGKSTVGRLLAARWDCPFVDMDDEIERGADMSIAEIFAAEGEPGFRRREANVVHDVCGRNQTVIAAGGGAVVNPTSRDEMQRSGQVVWLTASAESILARMSGDETTAARRPNLTKSGGDDEVRRLLAERTPIYSGAADLEVDTEGTTADEVADAIAAGLAWSSLPAEAR